MIAEEVYFECLFEWCLLILIINIINIYYSLSDLVCQSFFANSIIQVEKQM